MKKTIRIGRAPALTDTASQTSSDGPLSCPKPWDTLEETGTPGVRYCPDCRKNVFQVDTTQQVHAAGLLDRCVAIAEDSTYFKERNDAMPPSPVAHRLATVTLLVREQDEALRFFTEALRFELVEDTSRGPGKRRLVVAPAQGSGSAGATLLLARAETDEQETMVGRQAGGRVFLYLHTADFAADHAHMKAHGVRFIEEPRHEPHGTVAIFLDLCGNRWDLIQPA